jgi:hypothetical protein
MTMSFGLISLASCRSTASPGGGEVIVALADLAAKPLAEEIGDIGPVVDHQNAVAHTDAPVCAAPPRGRSSIAPALEASWLANSYRIDRAELDRLL